MQLALVFGWVIMWRALLIKQKLSKWDLIKIKSFCTTKETTSKVKRQPSEWEKIITNEATDKQLISKINKWDLIKCESFCTTQETISKVKRQPSEWEKIIANEATDQQLISKIYKQLLQLNSEKNK